jgi:hypothetical protein
MGALSKTVLGEHYAIAKSAGSISVGEILGLALAAGIFYLGGKLKIPDKYRFPLCLLVIFIFCMVD